MGGTGHGPGLGRARGLCLGPSHGLGRVLVLLLDVERPMAGVADRNGKEGYPGSSIFRG